MIRHLINLLLWPLPPTRLFALRRTLLRFAGIELGPAVCICGRGWIYGRGRFVVGAGSWISPGTIVHTHAHADIVIGKGCDIGPSCEFIAGSHEIGPRTRRAGAGLAAPIAIEDGCWLGAGVLVLGGVRIGAGSIVAAGAVVARDLAPDVLAAGVPAAVKRKLD